MIHRLFLPLILATIASAQIPDLKAVLDLSDTQVISLVQLQQQKASTLQPMVVQFQQHKQQLQQLLASNPDPATVGRAFIEMGAIGAQIQQTVAGFQQQALNLLRPEQKTQIQSLGNVLRFQKAAQQAAALGLLIPSH